MPRHKGAFSIGGSFMIKKVFFSFVTFFLIIRELKKGSKKSSKKSYIRKNFFYSFLSSSLPIFWIYSFVIFTTVGCSTGGGGGSGSGGSAGVGSAGGGGNGGNNGATCLAPQFLQNGVCITGGQDQDHNGLIEIVSVEQLYNVRNALNGKWYSVNGSAPVSTGCPIITGETSGTCRGYELVRNLDFVGSKWSTGAGWEPIGVDISKSFTATFEGNGFTIQNLYINNSSTNELGLFGYLKDKAKLSNVGLINVTFWKNGSYATGGLVGTLDGGILSNNYVIGWFTLSNGTKIQVGGLVGRQNSGSIINSYARVSVVGKVNADKNIGGLVGLLGGGSISNSYALGWLSVNGDGNNSIGGLVGTLEVGTISNSYATGWLTSSGTGTNDVGGLVGMYKSGTINNSYWDMTTTWQTTSAGTGAIGLTTPEMQATSGVYPSLLGTCFQFNMYKYPKLYTWDANLPTPTCTVTLLSGENAMR